MKLVIENIGMLATPVGTSARSGREQGNVRILNNACDVLRIPENGWCFLGTGIADDTGEGKIWNGECCCQRQTNRQTSNNEGQYPRSILQVLSSIHSKRIKISEFARICGLSRPTVYKYLKII